MKISYNIITNISDLMNDNLKNNIMLTEYDFLYKYDKNQDDTMILNVDIKEEDLEKSNVIGRVF
jgi:hypothetical protein